MGYKAIGNIVYDSDSKTIKAVHVPVCIYFYIYLILFYLLWKEKYLYKFKEYTQCLKILAHIVIVFNTKPLSLSPPSPSSLFPLPSSLFPLPSSPSTLLYVLFSLLDGIGLGARPSTKSLVFGNPRLLRYNGGCLLGLCTSLSWSFFVQWSWCSRSLCMLSLYFLLYCH